MYTAQMFSAREFRFLGCFSAACSNLDAATQRDPNTLRFLREALHTLFLQSFWSRVLLAAGKI